MGTWVPKLVTSELPYVMKPVVPVGKGTVLPVALVGFSVVHTYPGN